MSRGEMSKGKAVVVGAGPVGGLCACILAKRGYQVEVYELRSDIRKQEYVVGRSINLALSHRSIESLKTVGLEQEILPLTVPMYGRLIHSVDSTKIELPYGDRKKMEFLNSVDRAYLNCTLIDAAERYPNVKFYFKHKLIDVNPTSGQLKLLNLEEPSSEPVDVEADLVIASDGAFSTVRQKIMKLSYFDYSQEWIPHAYKELRLHPTPNNEYAMEVNYLHIWPRNEFMMIALPNLDKSFTITLFMPVKIYDRLQTEEDVMNFFKETFPDAVPLLGEDNIKESFFRLPPLPVISIKCNPHHRGKVLMIGDAAHAMVPFYGQGLNCGLEDCLVLEERLDMYSDDLGKVLCEYTKFRCPDVQAMNDLSMYNYIEMREHVNSKLFRLKKMFDNFIHKLFPSRFIPLYQMVTFSRIRYHDIIRRSRRQDKIVNQCLGMIGVVTGVSVFIAAAYIGYRLQ